MVLRRVALLSLLVIVLLGVVASAALSAVGGVRPAGSVSFKSLGAMRFTGDRTTIECRVTLRGSFESSIAEIYRDQLGAITEVSIARESCVGGEVVSVLRLPWAIRYSDILAIDARREAIPDNVAGLQVSVTGARFLFRGYEVSTSCLYEGVLRLLFVLTRTSQGYKYNYTFGLATVNEREPLNSTSNTCVCPGRVTVGATLEPDPPQEIAFATVIGPKSWVASVGDSYISGEGGRWAGNTAELPSEANDVELHTYHDNETRSAERIPLCHRSTSAEIHIGHGVESINFACSGGRTYTFVDEEESYKPGVDFGNEAGDGQLDMLQEFARDHWVRMVAVSIGGNDFEFGRIVKACVTAYITNWGQCSEDPAVLENISEESVAARKRDIKEAIRRVNTAMIENNYTEEDFTIVVQNYELVIPPAASFRYPQAGWERWLLGGCPFWNVDAEWAIEPVLPTINETVMAAAAETGIRNLRTMDVAFAFYGHRLCEFGLGPEYPEFGVGLLEDNGFTSWRQEGVVDRTEWVVAIETVATEPHLVQEGLHPNYWGQLALRNCVRQVYNEGSPRGGRCEMTGTGLTADGEPRMTLR